MRYLMGVDDTDNLESRGTGHRVRQLGQHLEAGNLARLVSITRHQLLVDERIPYTSHNSAACLSLEAEKLEPMLEVSRAFLLRESAPGSDVGLCIIDWPRVSVAVQEFGHSAKRTVLEKSAAVQLAHSEGIHLEELTGTGGGIIGALAAVGLHSGGNDGRFLWLRNLRELEGVVTVAQLKQAVGIEAVQTLAGKELPAEARVDVGEWLRPILRAGKILLLVEANDHDNADWRIADKARIKQLSD